MSGFSCSPALLPLSLSVSPPLPVSPPPLGLSRSVSRSVSTRPYPYLSTFSLSPLFPLSPSPLLAHLLSRSLCLPLCLHPPFSLLLPPFSPSPPFSLSPRCLCLPLCLPLSPSPPLSPLSLPFYLPDFSVSPLSPSSLALLPFPSLLHLLLSPRSFCLTFCLSLSPLVPLSPFPSLYLPSLTLSPAVSLLSFPSSSLTLFLFSSPLSFSPETTHSAKRLILNAHVLTQDEIFVNSSCENESRVNDYLTDMRLDML